MPALSLHFAPLLCCKCQISVLFCSSQAHAAADAYSRTNPLTYKDIQKNQGVADKQADCPGSTEIKPAATVIKERSTNVVHADEKSKLPLGGYTDNIVTVERMDCRHILQHML